MRLKAINKGFTVVELMAVIVIIGVLVAIGLSVYTLLIHRKNLELATSEIINKIELSKALANRENKNMYMTFQAGDPWCLGVSDVGVCNCNAANSCLVTESTSSSSNVRELVFKSTAFSFNSTIALSNFTNSSTLVFKAVSGVFTSTGVVTITFSGNSTVITVSPPSVIACSDDLSEYSDC